MGHLLYSALTSLDGYVNDAGGGFRWAEPDEEVHAAVNDLVRGARTHLYGRRMYEVMVAWETMPTEGEPAPLGDFAAMWRAADKVVYSRTLDAVSTARTRLEREFDADAVRAMEGGLTVSGPGLAADAFAAGIVDEVHLFVSPVAVGGGTPALPRDARVDLALVDVGRFANGVVHLHYEPR